MLHVSCLFKYLHIYSLLIHSVVQNCNLDIFSEKVTMYQTTSKQKPNIFIEEFKKYILFFRICFFFPWSKDQPCGVMMINLIRIAKTLFCLCILFIFCFSDPGIFECWKTMQSLSRHAIFFGYFITLVVCLVNADLTKDRQSKMFELFEQIDTELQFKLLVVIDYVHQKRQIFKKLGVSAILLLSIFIGTIINDYYERKALILTFAKKLQANLIFVRCLQLVFYIDLTKMRMDMIKSRLNQFLMGRTKIHSSKQTYQKISTMKNVYRQIWEITYNLNKCFGMSLLSITTFFFLDFVCKLLELVTRFIKS